MSSPSAHVISFYIFFMVETANFLAWRSQAAVWRSQTAVERSGAKTQFRDKKFFPPLRTQDMSIPRGFYMTLGSNEQVPAIIWQVEMCIPVFEHLQVEEFRIIGHFRRHFTIKIHF